MKNKKLLLSSLLLVTFTSCGGASGVSSVSSVTSDTNSEVSSGTSVTTTTSIFDENLLPTDVPYYEVNFKGLENTISNEDLDSTISSYVVTNELIYGASGNNVRGTGQGQKIRLGTTLSDGSITLKCSRYIDIRAVVVYGNVYSKDADTTITVSAVYDDNRQSVTKTFTEAGDPYKFVFKDKIEAKEFTIATTDGKHRLEIDKIGVYAGPSDIVDKPAEPTQVINSNFTITDGNVTKVDVPYEGYYKASRNENFTFDVMNNFNWTKKLQHEKKSKILVVPVDFADYRAEKKLEGGAAGARETITKAFFGNSEDTGWESLKSYYEKTSYGALSFEGAVTDWYHADYTTKEFAQIQSYGEYSQYFQPTWKLLDEITEWCTNTLNMDLNDFDSDGDGYIDGIWMVYSCPQEYNSDQDNFWAYTYSNMNNYYNQNAKEEGPLSFCYAWASYNFLFEGGYDKPDLHTFIHETGHMLGLDDYYDYDGVSGVTGGIDMMDYNVGDHNAFSKYLMNWTSPYVLDGTKDKVEIVLRPFESSGDFILLRDTTWNKSVFDEYIAIEYYTPTGLNAKDVSGYGKAKTTTYKRPGVKMWHVDSRYACQKTAMDGKTVVFQDYVDDWVDTDDLYYDYFLPASNTGSRSINVKTLEGGSKFRLLSLIQADKSNSFATSNYSASVGADANLFHYGDTFTLEDYAPCFAEDLETKKPIFNDGTTLPYKVEIGEMTAEGVKIIITKL